MVTDADAELLVLGGGILREGGRYAIACSRADEALARGSVYQDGLADEDAAGRIARRRRAQYLLDRGAVNQPHVEAFAALIVVAVAN